MKKYILIFSALLSFDALADDTPPMSGSCAKANTDSTCTWSFDISTNTLTISGTGQMEDYVPKINIDVTHSSSTAPGQDTLIQLQILKCRTEYLL